MDQHKMLGALKKLAETITQTFDVDALLLGILTACLEVSEAGRGALYLLDDGGTALALRAKIGFSPKALIDVRYEVPSKARE
jgi:GAF domain-containing protein